MHILRWLIGCVLLAGVLPWASPPSSAAAPVPLTPLLAQPLATAAPANTLARLRVAQSGIVELSGSMLANAGVNISQANTALLQIWHADNQVAIEIADGSDGRLDANDTLRFYAAEPGDRWNASDTYWLVQGSSAGQRMQQRSALPGSAPLSSTAVQRGRWRWHNGAIYDTRYAGPLGDHWYGGELRSETGSEVALTIPLTVTLPLASGTITATVGGTAKTATARTLTLRSGAASQSLSAGGSGNFSQTYTLPVNPAQVELVVPASASPIWLELQYLEYLRPITLSLSGQGAAFEGWPSSMRYQISNAASDRALYDVSDAQTPIRLTIPSGASFSFEDGPGKRYLLTGPGTLVTPTVAAFQATDLITPQAIDLIYIAPALFHEELAPLLAHRVAQGYTPLVVEPQAIYDTWSAGQVDPLAIRRFLQHVHTTWPEALEGVVLVGDGTADPLNHIRRNNTNFVPPLLAMVDPYLGETACEICYAQLDGSDPTSDMRQDVPLGRFPVKSEAELTALVAKILAYETGPTDLEWQARVLFVADNAFEADGTPDLAGNFATFSDETAARVPAGIEVRKLYYDPSPSRPDDPAYEADSLRARERTLRLISDGAAMVTYAGHSGQFQWAVTDLSKEPSYLLGLYDADLLSNVGRSAIFRNMTCLTSAFHTPAFSGTSIDERLLLQPGGAAAIWGSTGLGVSFGHDLLIEGFDQAFWQLGERRMGRLTMAGAERLLSSNGCCKESVWTFVLLGDPLTSVRVTTGYRALLPNVVR
ncbi:MAG: C25 family cysteine peptidase [Roseiflexaceae bacterium]